MTGVVFAGSTSGENHEEEDGNIGGALIGSGLQLGIFQSLLNYGMQASSNRHTLEELAGPKAVSRRRCIACYRDFSRKEGSKFAAKHARKVNTRCSQCRKHFCINCFNVRHETCTG